MYSLASLPAELIIDIAGRLGLGDAIRLNSTCRQIRATLQIHKFFWLLHHFTNATPNREQAMRQTSRLVLSRFLLYWIMRNDDDSDLKGAMQDGNDSDLKELIQHGASIALVPHGDVVNQEILKHGVSSKLLTLLGNGASLHAAPGGIHNLLARVFVEHSCGPEVDFLLEHGASFVRSMPPGHLLEMAITQWGRSEEVDLLLKHGCKLHRAPLDLSTLYCDIEYENDPSGYQDDHEFGELMFALRQVEKDIPSELPTLLEEVYRGCGYLGPIQGIFLEEPGWSLRKIPGGISRLLGETQDTENIVFLLQHGAFLDPADLRRDSVAKHMLSKFGPGAEMEYILENCGVSFSNYQGGIDTLLEEIYLDYGPGSRVDYLIDQWGADIRRVPGGLLELLQNSVLNHGLDSTAATQLMQIHGLSLYDVPCGLPRLLSGAIQTTKQHPQLYALYEEYITSFQGDQKALDLILEGVFGRIGRDPITELLLERGASFDRVLGGAAALIEKTWRRSGASSALKFLLQETAVSMCDVPGGIDALLEWELLRGAEIASGTPFNADFLLSHGASLDRTPSGGDQILSKILNKSGYSVNARWLISHGVPRKIMEEWQNGDQRWRMHNETCD